jgi:ADP-ribose pyrophosphatase
MKTKKIRFGKLKTEYKGSIFTIKKRNVWLEDGSKHVFEYCQRPASVSMLALNDKNELLMIKELRYGHNKNVWFLPGGRVDQKNDTPKKAVIREMREESGYRAKDIKLLYKKSQGSTLIWDIYIFAGKNLVFDPLPKDFCEKTKTYFVPFKKAVQMALDGTIENEFISYNIIRFGQMLKNKEFKWK